ncbi:MAG: SDR family NAD(P)-dependent oxidoreductase [Sulfuricaulis sp.]|nr:SDR family NAD(P)-dependent oxidoreductase [Sulfuricaulis sp.]
MSSSTQRVVLVTGAASGIGLATARRFAADHLKVILLDRSEGVHAIAKEFEQQGFNALALVADLGDVEQIQRASETVKTMTGGCDILVNNAGIHPKRNGITISLEEMTLEDWETVFRINLTAPFLLCQKFIGGMKARQWGRIINVTSRAARTYSDRAGTHYSASKAGLIGMTRKIAGDYAAFGVTANCVAPGQIETPLARTSDPKVLANAAKTTPAGRLGTADEVASSIQYLASDAAGFITGAVIDVNGGGFIG